MQVAECNPEHCRIIGGQKEHLVLQLDLMSSKLCLCPSSALLSILKSEDTSASVHIISPGHSNPVAGLAVLQSLRAGRDLPTTHKQI